MAGRLSHKTAIVTGAASGIGLATALRLLSDGANVVMADLPAALTLDFRSRWHGEARMSLLECDVTRDADIDAACAHAIAKFGKIDIVVNNAGAMIFKPLLGLTRADWLSQLDVNLVGPAMFIRSAFARMANGGAIVNVASVHARQTTANVAAYAAAKAGLDSLTRSASIEGRARGIRVNAVLPGAIDTPLLRSSPNIESGVETIDPADLGTPEQVSAAIAFLVSDEAGFISGASFTVDGGRLARL